jgi:hypothetical protein
MLGCGQLISTAEPAHRETVAAARMPPLHAPSSSPASQIGAIDVVHLDVERRPFEHDVVKAHDIRMISHPLL